MRVLFVCSGNNRFGVSPLVSNQGESLREIGIDIDYFLIKGNGALGYIKNIPRLRNYIKKDDYDLIHAHYSFSAYVASLSCTKPVVVSLMGCDVKKKNLLTKFVRLFHSFRWSTTIVKSDDMKQSLGIDDVRVIPNGVDCNKFKPIDKSECQKNLGWKKSYYHLLFAANPNRPVKNFSLFEQAFKLLKKDKINLRFHVLDGISHDKIPLYMNASDVVCLTSKSEGSPNVIKEAMSTNCPIVATDVGDISWLFGNEPGHYLCSFDHKDVATKMRLALQFSKGKSRTNGRKRIKNLNLDSEAITNKISDIYETILRKV